MPRDDRSEAIEQLISRLRNDVDALERGLRKRAPRRQVRSLARLAGYERAGSRFREQLDLGLRDVGVIATPSLIADSTNAETWITFGPSSVSQVELQFPSERELSSFIFHNWHRIEPLRQLQLMGREVTVGPGAKCDLLAFDERSAEYVVIETKTNVSDERLPAQLDRYMKAVHRSRAKPDGHGVRGIVVAPRIDSRLKEFLENSSSFPVDWLQLHISLELR